MVCYRNNPANFKFILRFAGLFSVFGYDKAFDIERFFGDSGVFSRIGNCWPETSWENNIVQINSWKVK